jgi:hypothetical protein
MASSRACAHTRLRKTCRRRAGCTTPAAASHLVAGHKVRHGCVGVVLQLLNLGAVLQRDRHLRVAGRAVHGLLARSKLVLLRWLLLLLLLLLLGLDLLL